jgi:hypothetical protein
MGVPRCRDDVGAEGPRSALLEWIVFSRKMARVVFPRSYLRRCSLGAICASSPDPTPPWSKMRSSPELPSLQQLREHHPTRGCPTSSRGGGDPSIKDEGPRNPRTETIHRSINLSINAATILQLHVKENMKAHKPDRGLSSRGPPLPTAGFSSGRCPSAGEP